MVQIYMQEIFFSCENKRLKECNITNVVQFINWNGHVTFLLLMFPNKGYFTKK